MPKSSQHSLEQTNPSPLSLSDWNLLVDGTPRAVSDAIVSILVDDPTVKPLSPLTKEIGLTTLVTTSDGEKIANPRHFNHKFKRLKAAQKALSRKKLDSNNRDKAQLKVGFCSRKDCRRQKRLSPQANYPTNS